MDKNISGVMVVNKPKGITSFDVVKKISQILGTHKVGHTGTLDPLAEGVLMVCVGNATKIVELLTAYDKEYIAGVKLGLTTDTYDSEGKVLDTKEVPENLSLEETIKSFQKTYLQEVPIYSAVKVDGKKLYEYARSGKEVELPKKEVTIHEIELLSQGKDEFTFRAKVSKGCYIRSLIHEIGLSLNTYAIMTSLTRTKQGKVSIEEAYTLDQIEKGEYKLYSIEEVLPYPVIEVEGETEFKIKNGVKISNDWKIENKVLFKDNKGHLLGIYQVEENELKVWKNFPQE